LSDNGMDMHEAIITRGDVSGNKKLGKMIMVSENCVIVHHGKCHEKAATKEGQRKVIKHLIYWEGYAAIYHWLQCLAEEMKGNQADTALELVSEVWNELSSV